MQYDKLPKLTVKPKGTCQLFTHDICRMCSMQAFLRRGLKVKSSRRNQLYSDFKAQNSNRNQPSKRTDIKGMNVHSSQTLSSNVAVISMPEK